jgi:hypothetical protein
MRWIILRSREKSEAIEQWPTNPATCGPLWENQSAEPDPQQVLKETSPWPPLMDELLWPFVVQGFHGTVSNFDSSCDGD